MSATRLIDQLFFRHFLPRKFALPRRFLSLLADVILAASAVILAFCIRYTSETLTDDVLRVMLIDAVLFAGVFAVAQIAAGMPKRLWRHVTVEDLTRLTIVSLLAVLCFYIVMFVATRLEDVPRSVPPLHWLLLLTLTGSARLIVRFWFHREYGKQLSLQGELMSVPVLLVGTGFRTSMFIRSAKASGFVPYRPIGILDIKSNANTNRLIDGIPIYGSLSSLETDLKKLDNDGLKPNWLVVCEELPGTKMGELVAAAKPFGIKVAKSPQLIRLAEAEAENTIELRPIRLEDLLGRAPAKLDLDAIGRLLKGKRVLVTGAGGSIGSELCRMITARRPSELVIMDASEFNLYSIDQELRSAAEETKIIPVLADIRRRHVMMARFKEYQPEIVFHAAALKHVPMVEANPLEGIETNVFGTKNVADAAVAFGAAAMIMVSSDKAVSPTSVMGASKRAAESYCQSFSCGRGNDGSTRLITVRFGNVLGSSGSVVPLFQQQLAKGGPLTITHPKITRYFMTINEAVELVLQAGAHILSKSEGVSGVAVLDMGKPIPIYDLACHIARLSGFEPGKDIEIKTVGLRPGEKLFEELFAPEEVQIPTDADGIFMAKSVPMQPKVLERKLTELSEAIRNQNAARGLEILASIVPGYKASKPKDLPSKAA